MPSALLKSSQPTIMEAQDPMKNAVGVLEKKMRNLEKRKGRIEGYEKLASSGSKLNEDQKASLEQKEFLNHNLDLVKELHKQMSQLCEEYQRHQKKEQKRAKMEQKEQAHKEAAGTITKVIEVRFLLDSLTEDVRGDFLSGTNGACLLTEDNFAKLDEIYKLINPAEDEDTTKAFADKVSAACRHLQDLVESKDKPILETTYSEIYKILMQVNDCGYFSKTENEQEAVVDELAPEEGGIEFTNDVEEHVQPSTVPQDLPIADNGDHVTDESLDQKQSQMNAGSPEFVPRNMQQMPAGESQTPEQSEQNDTNGGNDDEWKEQGHGQGSRQFKPRDGRGGRGSRGGNYGGRGGRGARGGRGHDTRNHNGAPREGGQQRRGGPPREGGYRGGQRDGRGGGGYRDQNRQTQQ